MTPLGRYDGVLHSYSPVVLNQVLPQPVSSRVPNVPARRSAMALCPSVRPSVTSRRSIETSRRVELVFGMQVYIYNNNNNNNKQICIAP